MVVPFNLTSQVYWCQIRDLWFDFCLHEKSVGVSVLW